MAAIACRGGLASTAQPARHARCAPSISGCRAQRRTSVRLSALPNEEAMKQMMQDPAMAEKMKAMQEAMQRPEVQQQMAQMQQVMQNQALQQRMAELKNDPEFAGMFEEIQKGGLPALMKFMNDEAVLAKLGSKLGPVVPTDGAGAPAAAAAAAAAAPVQPPQAPAAAVPDIDNLLDAARYGDLEAVEDFIAIGKDVNMVDKEKRTPLHWAAGTNRTDIAQLLLESGAQLENQDSKGNTPLHYSAGYGRIEMTQLLINAGANVAAQNSTGKRPADVATLDPRNPLAANEALMAKLRA